MAAARSAGLEPGTERHEEAVWQLLVEGALTVNECFTPKVAVRWPFGRTPYKLAAAVMRMLEEA